MGGTGIILVSFGLIVISLIPRTAEIIYIALGILAGNLNHTDIKIMELTAQIISQYCVIN
jgi:hypothetical protein